MKLLLASKESNPNDETIKLYDDELTKISDDQKRMNREMDDMERILDEMG